MEKNPVFSSFSSFEEFQTAWRKLPNLASQMQFAAKISYEQLMMQDLKNRNRVVHVLALDSKWINELPITCPGDDPRCFVPRRFLTPELLLIKGNGGNSVAHWMLWSDCLPMRLLTPEILLCATDEKRTVLYDIPLLLNSMLDRHTEYALAQIEKIPCAVFPLLLEEVERKIDYIPASRNKWIINIKKILTAGYNRKIGFDAAESLLDPKQSEELDFPDGLYETAMQDR